jgi:hypothetical protein
MASMTIATDRSTMASLPSLVRALVGKEQPPAKAAHGADARVLNPKPKNATAKTTIATGVSTTMSNALAVPPAVKAQRLVPLVHGALVPLLNRPMRSATAKTTIATA